MVVGGSPSAPNVIDRRRIEIADPRIRGSKQPFHAAEPLALKDAEKLIQRCAESTHSLAVSAVRAVLSAVRAQGCEVVGCGLLTGSGRPLPGLPAILASHPLIHTAEGEFFREALAQASERCTLPIMRVRERELEGRASAALRLPADKLNARIAGLGKTIGPPWAQDQKLAALAAWLALAGTSK
ncbi:MAG TPA: hypothetical protein VNN18_05700 [Candidatus Xenobia bacterium]|nr:hypothetical protein [Candidatus Xenobia bacterium]